MSEQSEQITIIYNEAVLTVIAHNIGSQPVYRVTFPDSRKPLIITQATDSRSKDFWTSLPQGRQNEAEDIGALITDHQKKR